MSIKSRKNPRNETKLTFDPASVHSTTKVLSSWLHDPVSSLCVAVIHNPIKTSTNTSL